MDVCQADSLFEELLVEGLSVGSILLDELMKHMTAISIVLEFAIVKPA